MGMEIQNRDGGERLERDDRSRSDGGLRGRCASADERKGWCGEPCRHSVGNDVQKCSDVQ
jgi:hypothetical protein